MPLLSPEGSESEHDRDVTHVTRILGRLLLLLLHPGLGGGLDLLGCVFPGLGFSWWRLLVVGLVVVPQVLLVFEHLTAVLALEVIIVLVPLLVPLSVRDGVEYDATEGAPVGHPLLGGEMGQLVLVQLSLEPEGPAADVAVQLVRVITVLGSLVLHPAAVAGEDGPALPPTGVGLDAGVTV